MNLSNQNKDSDSPQVDFDLPGTHFFDITASVVYETPAWLDAYVTNANDRVYYVESSSINAEGVDVNATYVVFNAPTETSAPEIYIFPVFENDKDSALQENVHAEVLYSLFGYSLDTLPQATYQPEMKADMFLGWEMDLGAIYYVNIDEEKSIPVQIYTNNQEGFTKVRFLNDYSSWFAQHYAPEDTFKYLIAVLRNHNRNIRTALHEG